MRRFIGTLARIVFGLILASLAAGLVTVLFVDIEVFLGPLDRRPTLAETIDLALLAATHVGIFSSLFVIITAAIGEWLSIRALTFYLIVGITIALLGFSAQYASEVAGQPTIMNNYAVKAFLTVGFVGGFVYWLAAGQFAGRAPISNAGPVETTTAKTVVAAGDEGEADDAQVLIARPLADYERSRWRMPVLERLKFRKRDNDGAPAEDTSAGAAKNDEEAPRGTHTYD